MATQILTSSLAGYGAVPVAVEADMSKNLPAIIIVGMGNKSIDEAKERIKSALVNSSLSLPKRKITINLAPADLPKDGSSFDLAMACAILSLSEQVPSENLQNLAIYGELSLDGAIRPVRGIVAHVSAAKKMGVATVVVPRPNLEQAQLVSGVTILPCSNLRELYLHLTGSVTIKHAVRNSVPETRYSEPAVNFSDITGQDLAKRALEIAAAGRHNLLMTGSPGAGKTLLARALQGILPAPSREEIVEMTQIHSLVDKGRDKVITERPFRAPHHSASQVSLVGGSQKILPGDVSLAHGGVLFLDELPEFSRFALEALRQPLEDGVITVARAQGSTTYPARSMLIATRNPCPCGYAEDTDIECSCSPIQLINYSKRLSGPLLDRIDMVVRVERINHHRLLENNSSEPSSHIAKRVATAAERQLSNRKTYNAYLSSREVKRLNIQTEAITLLNNAATKLLLSPRSYMKIIKVAQTIADLSKMEQIERSHIAEALQYRLLGTENNYSET